MFHFSILFAFKNEACVLYGARERRVKTMRKVECATRKKKKKQKQKQKQKVRVK